MNLQIIVPSCWISARSLQGTRPNGCSCRNTSCLLAHNESRHVLGNAVISQLAWQSFYPFYPSRAFLIYFFPPPPYLLSCHPPSSLCFLLHQLIHSLFLSPCFSTCFVLKESYITQVSTGRRLRNGRSKNRGLDSRQGYDVIALSRISRMTPGSSGFVLNAQPWLFPWGKVGWAWSWPINPISSKVKNG